MDEAQFSSTGTVLNPGWGRFDSAFFPWHREPLYRFAAAPLTLDGNEQALPSRTPRAPMAYGQDRSGHGLWRSSALSRYRRATSALGTLDR
jgi:hypothetical protein